MKKGDFYAYRRGFTFVEVSLVFAIAGLIFLMVFIALPAVQRTQRDAERQEDLSTLIMAIKEYQQNNRGALPLNKGLPRFYWYGVNNTDRNWDDFIGKYLGGEDFADPDGEIYQLHISECNKKDGTQCTNVSGIENKTFPNDHTIYLFINASCDGSTAVGSDNPRKVAAVYKLEGAGAACKNS